MEAILENYDVNTKTLKKNAFRITKRRYKTAIRIRVPGGHLDVKHFDIIKEIANKYVNGTVHITTRQGLEIPATPAFLMASAYFLLKLWRICLLILS